MVIQTDKSRDSNLTAIEAKTRKFKQKQEEKTDLGGYSHLELVKVIDAFFLLVRLKFA